MRCPGLSIPAEMVHAVQTYLPPLRAPPVECSHTPNTRPLAQHPGIPFTCLLSMLAKLISLHPQLVPPQSAGPPGDHTMSLTAGQHHLLLLRPPSHAPSILTNSTGRFQANDAL